MSGIENGGQHCFVNMLMQCLSVNQTLVNALHVHSRNHVDEIGMYHITLLINFLCKEYSVQDFSKRLQIETSIGVYNMLLQ